MIIITTASRLSSNIQILKKMILAGSDILRFNFSYGTHQEKKEAIKNALNIINELNATTRILTDLPSPKIRLGGFPFKEVYIKEGDNVILKSEQFSENPTDYLPIQLPDIGNLFLPEQMLIIDEGEVALKIMNIISTDAIECIALNSGFVFPYKGINWNNQKYDYKINIDKIKNEILPDLISLKPDYIACPFVDNETTAKSYKEIIDEMPWEEKPKIVFKIETKESVNNLEQIFKYGDLFILERGNLGMQIPFEKIGIIQKQIINLCKKKQKPIMISTQILESIIHNFIPQRSDILDLTNIVLDGADGIVLCHETGVSSRPAYAIVAAKKIIAAAEEYKRKL